MNSFILTIEERAMDKYDCPEVGLLSQWQMLFHSLDLYRSLSPLGPCVVTQN
jgi:hypothetical protein